MLSYLCIVDDGQPASLPHYSNDVTRIRIAEVKDDTPPAFI